MTTTRLDELHSPLASTSTDRCPNCSAQLAPDQRYCIECGERRAGGGLRDALPRRQAAAAAPPRARRRSWSPSASLIAGVATLLLAMGVGVLIGRTGNSHNATATNTKPVQVVVPAASSANSATGTTAAAATAATAHAVKKHTVAKAHKAAAKASTAQTDVQKTAAKSGVKLPPAVVKVGQKCPKGAAGCQGGKFTGNFFGGGG